MLAKVLLLKQLYLRKLVGERYCQNISYKNRSDIPLANFDLSEIVNNCSLCELSKCCKDRVYGKLDSDCDIVFITLMPVLQYSISYEMLSNIALKVFARRSFSVLSLIKCNTYSEVKDSHIMVCKEYLYKQINTINPRLIVLFGHEVAMKILCVDDELKDLKGRILDAKIFENKNTNQSKIIVTYAIYDLIKNLTFKKQAFEDFKAVREALKF